MPPRYVARWRRIRGPAAEFIWGCAKRALILGGIVSVIYLPICMVRDWHVPGPITWFIDQAAWFVIGFGIAFMVLYYFAVYKPAKGQKEDQPDSGETG